MNEVQRSEAAKQLLLERRQKFAHLPEPERTYAFEFSQALEIIRLKEENQEIEWGGRG